ncbi:MAG: glycoside hydrolase family 97 N-terminal domain-containing protein, partial [Chloroflexi bacterium]|nr:glycoside hydrolase family 97 N-terminal domain-containing protein [Chloroflexota bacterium]
MWSRTFTPISMPPAEPLPTAAGTVSPDGRLKVDTRVNAAGELVYSVSREKMLILEESRLGLWLDGVDLGAGVSLGEPRVSHVIDRFPSTAGVHAVAENSHTRVLIPLKH